MKNKAKSFVLILILFIVWWIGSLNEFWNTFLVPTPWKVGETFVELIQTGKIFKHLFISFSRIIIGSTITFCVAVPLGIIFGSIPRLYEYFRLPLEFMRSTPPLALMPMIILWFGIGETSKIIIIILASFFPLFLNTLSGISRCDIKLIEVGKTFGLNQKEIYKKIILPSAIPNILLGVKLAIGYSWRAIIGAEMIGASSGLGYLILDGQILSRSDIVLVGIISIGVFGSLTDIGLSRLMKKFLEKRGIINEEIYNK